MDEKTKSQDDDLVHLVTVMEVTGNMISPAHLLLLLTLPALSLGLDDGLARTPPMGWMSWERFLCNSKFIILKAHDDVCMSV